MAAVDADPATAGPSLQTLDEVQRRVLWLATSIIHHANKVRRTPSGVKVGGHQASSASMVSIMTALYFEHLRGRDRVSVKPHASPVLHAINYLLGRLDRAYLTELRSFGGLQSYPSRERIRTRSISQPDRSGSAPLRRSGVRWPTAMSPATSTSPRRGARWR